LVFSDFTAVLPGLPVSLVWQGYGSAIFLEFGTLTANPRRRRDGSWRHPIGEWTLGIEWSWRIEGKRRIWCGSWSDKEKWPRFLAKLQGATVDSVSIFGRLPEISLDLSNGLHLLSMMTSEGDPSWWLTKREPGIATSIYTRAGILQFDSRPSTAGNAP
jgi:hypothetical protein